MLSEVKEAPAAAEPEQKPAPAFLPMAQFVATGHQGTTLMALHTPNIEDAHDVAVSMRGGVVNVSFAMKVGAPKAGEP